MTNIWTGIISNAIRAVLFLLLSFTGCASKSPAVVAGEANQVANEVDEPFAAATPTAVVFVTKKVFPAVVRIDASQPTSRDGRQSVTRGIGSGVIYDAEGRILTNFHVAGRATEVSVTLFNKERVSARMIGSDSWTDLAVVQMDMAEIRARNIVFDHADFGDSLRLVPGQDVMAIGTPFGLARTMTLGTVSNVERTLYPSKLDIDGYETGGYSNWVQMDVPINPGNSGGPLVDLHGRVVGINTRGGAQNLNFAVPINTAKPIVAAIVRTATSTHPGRFDRSDLGIDFKPMQDLESYYKLDPNHGVLVNGVDQFSPAQMAGVRPQDVLLEIDGRAVNVRFPEELSPLMQSIAALPIGKAVKLKLQRGRREITLTATTSRLQGAIGEEISVSEWGVRLREITRTYANRNQLEAVAGMVVSSITPDLPASKTNLAEGDVIESIDGRPLSDLADFQRIAQDLHQSRMDGLLLTVRRGRGRRSVILNPIYPATLPVKAEAAPTNQSPRPDGVSSP